MNADICENRHGGNEQSRAAFAKVRPKAAALRARILAYLRAMRPAGLTCEQLAVRLDIRYVTMAARLSELKRDGLATDSGERRPTSSGATAAVIVAA
jgi:hypothetical protein